MCDCSSSLPRPASSRATTAMRSSSPFPMCRLWAKISLPFLPPLQLASPPASGSVASTPRWTVGTSSTNFAKAPQKNVCNVPAENWSILSPCCPGGVKVTCEYRTQHEGLLQEHITLVTRGRRESRLKVRLQAKVIGGSPATHQRGFSVLTRR